MFTLTQCLFGLAVGLISYLFMKMRKGQRYWIERGIKQSSPIPLFGNWYPLLTGKMSQSEFYIREYKKYPGEKLSGLYTFTKPSLVVRDPDYIQRILVRDFSHFVDRGVGINGKLSPLEESLLVLQGNRWRALRKALIPVFTSSKIKGMFPEAMKCGEQLVTYVESTGETEFQIKDLMAIYTADVIASTVFGFDLGGELNLNSEFVKHAKNVFMMTMSHRVSFLLFMAFPRLMSRYPVSLSNPKSGAYFGRILREVLQERKAARAAGKAERNDFMTMLLRLREKGTMKVAVEDPEDSYLAMEAHESVVEEELTDDLLMAQAYFFLTAGFDTTSTGLEFALFELSMNPDVQDKLREEVLAVLEEEGENLGYKSLAKMTYLDQCIKETLRMYPATPIVSRVCTKEYDLDGLKIYPGQNISVPNLAIHNDPQYFPEPHKFKPERFQVEPAKGTYMPFGDGPRICIGMRVAQMNLKLGLINVVKSFRIEQSSRNVLPIRFQPKAILVMPKDNLWCRLVKI